MAELGVAVAGLGRPGRARLRPLAAADHEDHDDGADHDRGDAASRIGLELACRALAPAAACTGAMIPRISTTAT